MAGFQHAGIFPPYKNNINRRLRKTFNPPTKAAIPSTLAITLTPVTSSTPTTRYSHFKKSGKIKN